MDRRLPLWLVLFFPLVFVSFLAFPASQKPHIVGVFEGIKREIAVSDGQLVGRFAPYYQCVFDRVEADVRFIEMPLAQMLHQLNKGGIAIGLPLVQTADRDEYADFGGLLFQTEYVYLLLDDLPPLASLKGVRYAFVRRFVADQLLQGENPQVTHVSGWGQAVEMLKRRRVDVVVLPWVMIDLYMADYPEPHYERTAAWVDLSMYISHAVSDGRLTEDLRQAIRECRFISEKT
ncbi:transporter substrate-binding domain-containing protein [Marinobacter sp. F3R08]|uniref:transporter substrate-binding domain-containing protein n=1 Tax=Marinobacter sp. F3R08 TaxID=2841559 RepID=UPI001C0917A6|nr:transporter substrate-binding domain-containing protein [Marinobacter sp. F3R08]MBU2954053.1 transporter substrate-binding domain-containing protein [Marinobacter sp. F3R08]